MTNRAAGGRAGSARPRWLVAALCLLVLLVLPQTAAGDDNGPQIGLGYADGLVSDRPEGDANRYLDAIASVVGPGGIVRAPAHWDPSVSGPPFGKYDAFVARLTERGMLWMPEIHLSHHGHYVLPGDSPGGYDAWQAGIRAFVNRYQPGGAYAQDHPGFPGITMYEIWNEPNTITGNTTPEHRPGDIDPATIDAVVEAGATAVRQAASDDVGPDFQPAIAGFAIGTIDVPYIQRLIAASSSVWSQLDMLTVHVYQSQPASSCDPANPHCIRGLVALRALLDQNDATRHLQLGITEGGYSGSDDSVHPPNVVSEQDQADWGLESIQWILANPQLRVGLYTPFQALDLGNRGYLGNGHTYDYPYWYEHLGAVKANGAMKPWGRVYRDFIEETDHQPPSDDTTPPTVPANLRPATTGGVPMLTWDASSDDSDGPVSYLVYRDGTLIDQSGDTTFTDSPPIAWGDDPVRDESFPTVYADGWGPDYDVAGDVSRYWTNGGRGMLQAEGPGASTQVLLRNHVTRAVDQTLTFELSHALSTTGLFRVSLLAHERGDDEFGDSYQVYVDFAGDGTGRLAIGKRAGDTGTDLAQVSGPIPVAAGVVYHLRLRVSGGTTDDPVTALRAKMWWGDAEPDYWNLVAADADGLQAGRIGIATETSTDMVHTPITVLVDDWQASNLAAVGPVTYDYTVAAQDAAGNLSDQSAPLAITFSHGGPDPAPPPGPPPNTGSDSDHPTVGGGDHSDTHRTASSHHATHHARPAHTATPRHAGAVGGGTGGSGVGVCAGPLARPARCV